VAPFKDYFGTQAVDYAEFRPSYPAALFHWLAAASPGRALAWDCATGSGQAALGLVPYFDRVIASDASEAQLRHARAHPRIEYRCARGEESGLEQGSVDLLTVAQALHWLDHSAFFAEARRVLHAGGVIAVWGYDLVRVSPEIDAVIDTFYHDTLRDCWAPERRIVEDHYRSVDFSFAELEPPAFTMERCWTLPHLLGYLRTWSATRVYLDREGRDPVIDVARSLTPLWPEPEEERVVRWELFVRAGVNA
jgi:hypothetical protein